MQLTVNYKIAVVYLTARVRQTIVAVLGVTFGISMYVFMNGFMTGVNDTQSNLAFTSMSHIRIYNDGPADNTNLLRNQYPPNTILNLRNAKVIRYTDGIKNSAEIISQVRKYPKVVALSPQVNTNVFFKNAGNRVNGVLAGVEVLAENQTFGISQYVIQGSWKALEYQIDGAIVGSELAQKLSIKINDNLNVLTDQGISKNFKVIGIFQTNVSGVDRSKVYINISAARQLLAVNQDYITDLQINVNDYNQNTEIAEELTRIVPYKVETWQKANQQLEAGSRLRDIIAKAVSLTILMVAGFGIYNIMNMTINEKIREIAILKAMGFAGSDVKVIFLTQAIVIGVIGGMVGMLLGTIICKLVNMVPFEIAGMKTLPMTYSFVNYAMAFMFGLVTTFVAGYLPARKASTIDPVTIIRG